jgi:hypothetical protein
MANKGQGAITQEVNGGLMARQQQQGGIHQHLMPREDSSFLALG